MIKQSQLVSGGQSMKSHSSILNLTVSFIMFCSLVAYDRYDMDFDDDVLYCYEIQLEESCRGKGLGKFMMKVFKHYCC